MSVILEALKKAEHERVPVEIPTVTSVHTEAERARRRFVPWAVAGAFLASSAVGLVAGSDLRARVGWFFAGTDRPVATVLNSAKREPSRKAPSFAEAERPVSTPQVGAPRQRVETAPVAGESRAPAISSTQTAPSLGKRAPRKAQQAPEPAPVAASSPLQPAEPPVPIAEIGAIVPDSPPPGDSLASAAVETPSVVPPGPGVEGPTRPSGTPPSRFRDVMAKLTLNGVVYSENPRYRKVYIGGRGYAEGDNIDGNIRIEEIREDGATFAYQEERALLRMAGR